MEPSPKDENSSNINAVLVEIKRKISDSCRLIQARGLHWNGRNPKNQRYRAIQNRWHISMNYWKSQKVKDETKSSTSAPRPDWKREGECHLRCHQGSAPAFASYLKGFLTHRCSQTGEFSSSYCSFIKFRPQGWLFQSELAQDSDHHLVGSGGREIPGAA